MTTTTHENSAVSLTLLSQERHEVCLVSADVLAKFGDTVIVDPVVSDGFGHQKVYVKCKFCNKDRLTMLAEMCRVDFKRFENLSKHCVYLSGNDSYYFQVKIDSLNATGCKCL